LKSLKVLRDISKKGCRLTKKNRGGCSVRGCRPHLNGIKTAGARGAGERMDRRREYVKRETGGDLTQPKSRSSPFCKNGKKKKKKSAPFMTKGGTAVQISVGKTG